MSVDIKKAVVRADDLANKELLGMVNPKTIKLMYFSKAVNAQWAADRLCQALAFPGLEVSFPSNRDLFKLKPGDPFILNLAKYNLSGIVMRVLHIREKSIESEEIIVDCAKDPNYASSEYSYTSALPSVIDVPTIKGQTVVPLSHTVVFEAPYALSGDDIRVVPLAARELGTEANFSFYISIDGGNSYYRLAIINIFQPHGKLFTDYSSERPQVDDDIGFTVDASYNADWVNVASISRENLFAGRNLAMLGNEIISFQNITPDPVKNGRYFISGVWGGRYDSLIDYHPASTDFFFIGDTFTLQADPNMLVGKQLYFKLVPIVAAGEGDISEASYNVIDIIGRAKTPYSISNLKANDQFDIEGPSYADDIILSWDARSRSSGAGTQLPQVPDDPDTWEGLFRIKVYHDILSDSSGIEWELVRDTGNINAQTWTYTEAMNLADGESSGAGIAIDLLFRVFNYIEDVGTAQIFESQGTSIRVTKALRRGKPPKKK